MNELYYSHSGVPVAFDCYYVCEVEDEYSVGIILLGAFTDERIKMTKCKEILCT